MKKFLSIIKWLIIILITTILLFKIGGTSYCYLKNPETKEEAEKVISFCNSGASFFDILYSESKAKIYEKYPDSFQNEGSATLILMYYLKNEPLHHLERIEKLTYIITEDVWNKERNFYFILEDSDFEAKLPLEFRRNIFKNIYEKYSTIIKADKQIDEEKRNNLINSLNTTYKTLNGIK